MDKAELGERLRSWRKKGGLTQRQAAFYFGVHPVTIGNWETGRHMSEESQDRIREKLVMARGRDRASKTRLKNKATIAGARDKSIEKARKARDLEKPRKLTAERKMKAEEIVGGPALRVRVSGMESVQDDTSPILGGDLDLNGHRIFDSCEKPRLWQRIKAKLGWS